MRSLAISGVALAAMMVSQPAFAEIDSAVGAPPVTIPPPASGSMGNPDNRRASAPIEQPIEQAPTTDIVSAQASRRLDYQRPSYGFQLPKTWMTPENYVDYRAFGLDRPDRKSTRLNSSHLDLSRMPSSA